MCVLGWWRQIVLALSVNFFPISSGRRRSRARCLCSTMCGVCQSISEPPENPFECLHPFLFVDMFAAFYRAHNFPFNTNNIKQRAEPIKFFFFSLPLIFLTVLDLLFRFLFFIARLRVSFISFRLSAAAADFSFWQTRERAMCHFLSSISLPLFILRCFFTLDLNYYATCWHREGLGRSSSVKLVNPEEIPVKAVVTLGISIDRLTFGLKA